MLSVPSIQSTVIVKKLRQKGFRITPARKTIIDILSEKQYTVSLSELKKHLDARNVRADRTTLYREILFLKKQGKICEIPIGGGKKAYKICKEGHHHHLICLRCHRVEEFILKNLLASQEREIVRRKGFKVLDHHLEFYGFCKDCQ